MAAAKKKTAAPPPDDFDAHQFQVMHEAANQLPRTARGGARDLTSADEKTAAPGTDVSEWISTGQEKPRADVMFKDRNFQPAPRMPTLAEAQERRRFVEGEAPAVDTIYREPQGVKPLPAAVQGARVRHGSDVHFKEEETVTPASVQEEPEVEEDPRIRFIDALNGSGPQKGELPAMQAKEDPRFKTVNGFRFYS
jgi:hypothetical protein